MSIQQRTRQRPGRPQPHAGRPMPEVAGVAHRYVATQRLGIHIATAGSGPPLLLLHGWPQHWYAWRKLIPLLAGSWQLVCPDLRGFGWTDAPASGYRTADLAADTVALLDALELNQVDVIGHGEGGRVAFELCLSHPGRVRRLVTLGAMRDLEGLGEQAVSDLLAVSVGTAKSRLHRARRRFRQEWDR